ncbi:MAG: DNA topoisomerase IB [Pseudomonadota bacterium]
MALRYYPDTNPGFTRQRRGRGFSYLAADGTRIDRPAVIDRLKALAVPPAYGDVWLSPYTNGHLQASGRDDAQRKQYIYHPDWAAQRAEVKFEQLVPFGEALPAIRRWITTRLGGEPGAFETAAAAVLALLDRASLRVGAPDYTAQNGSHGATTLLPEHAQIDDTGLTLRFPAKGGTPVETHLNGARLAAVLDDCQDLPGAHLITFGDGALIRSEHLREILSDLARTDITPKTFRTWNGTHAAFLAATQATTITALADAAAERLHNTPTIARTSYIHPKVIALAENDTRASLEDTAPDGYRRGEPALLDLLRG